MKQKSGGLAKDMRKLVVLPLLCFGVCALLIAAAAVYYAMVYETMDGLKNLAYMLRETCESAGEGDYAMQEGNLVKGGAVLNAADSVVSRVGGVSTVDVTLFWGDTRIVTSIHYKDGTKAVGTHASPEVTRTVLNEGKDYFSVRVPVNGTLYFGYYAPLTNSDGSVVGMVFVGKTRREALDMVIHSVVMIFAVMTAIIAAAAVISLSYTKRMIRSLDQMRGFLAEIASGNIETQAGPGLMERRDEIGEMGQFLLVLQKSMTKLISTDPLTGLYNRRSGSMYLERLVCRYQEKGTPVCAAIGDIDDFKKINDNYGHQAGDAVLVYLAELFCRHMQGKGVAARWGGEEFLFIFDGGERDKTQEYLQAILEELRGSSVSYAGYDIAVTMTFGAAQCGGGEDIEKLLKRADDNLYLGKQRGKNQIVQDE